MVAKKRRQRRGHNLKFLLQECDDIRAKIDGILEDLNRQLNQIATRRQAAVQAAHQKIERLQKDLARVTNLVARAIKEQDDD